LLVVMANLEVSKMPRNGTGGITVQTRGAKTTMEREFFKIAYNGV
jgi:hypothetical protein